jgi:hypothetical protein
MKKPDWLITLRNVETTNARTIHYVLVCVLIPHQQLLEFANRIFATFPSATLKSHFIFNLCYAQFTRLVFNQVNLSDLISMLMTKRAALPSGQSIRN